MIKIIAVVAGTAGALLLGAVFAVPSLVDWNAYKPAIAERLERDLGRDVEIAGDLSLSLLPRPSIAAEGIRLGAGEGGRRFDVASVEQLRLDLKFLPLLTGRLVVEDLVLVAPVLVVDTAAAPAQAEAPARPAGEAAAPRDDRQADFVVRRLAVRDGLVLLRDGGETAAELTQLEGTFEAQADDGPFRAGGAFTWQGARVGFDAAAGALSASPLPVSLALRLGEPAAEARLSGQIDRNGEHPALKGKLAVSGRDLQRLLAELAGIAAPPAAAAPFALEGEIAGTPQGASMPQASLRVGDAQGAGGIVLGLRDRPRVDVALAFGRVDLDRWLAVLDQTPAPAGEARGPAPTTPAAARSFSLDTPIAVAADLSAEALVYRGAILRQARLAATLSDGILHVGQAGALLPGGADAAVSGTLRARDGRPAFDGSFEASADNVRETLRWLDVDATGVPADRLRLFSATGRVAGSAEEVRLSDLDIALDASRLAGAVTVRPGARPSFGANLVADTVNVDAYRPRRAATPANGAASPAATATPGPALADGDWMQLFTGFDANLRARVGQLTVNEVTVSEVLVDGTLFNGDLTLRGASIGEIGGTSGRVSGVVEGLGRGELVVRDLAYELRSAQPDKALRLLGVELPVDAQQLGSLALTGTVDGGAQGLAVKMRVETAGGVAQLDGTVSDPLGALRYRFSAEASHASFAEVVRLGSPDYAPRGRLGGFALSMQVDGDGSAATLDDVRAKLGTFSAAGTARLGFAGRPHLQGAFTTTAVALSDFLPAERGAQRPAPPIRPVSTAPAAAGEPWSREPHDLSWLRGFDADLAVRGRALSWDEWLLDEPALDVTVRDGLLTIERLLGTLFDGRFSLQGRLSADGAASAVLEIAEAHLQHVPLRAGGLEVTGGVLGVGVSLATQGRSTAEMMSRLEGQGSLTARDGRIHGINLGEISRRLNDLDGVPALLRLLDAGRGGSTQFSQLSGTFKAANGIVGSDDLRLLADGGTADAVATVNLPRYTVDGRVVFRLTEHARAPAFVMRLRGPLDDPRREFDSGELQAWLVGRGVKQLMDRSERAGRVGEVLERVVPGLVPGTGAPPQEGEQPQAPPPAQQLLDGLMRQLR